MLNERRFAPLFWTQFLSAFGDNVLKNALVLVILHNVATSRGEALITAAGGVFIFPFVVLSGLGGELADRFDKAALTRWLKLAEIAVALLAGVGFLSQSIPTLFTALFLYGVIAAMFGPIKYGVLPEILRPAELGAGNALIESATFLAILFGTIFGGLVAHEQAGPLPAAAAVLALALLCAGTSRFMPPQTPANRHLAIDANILRSTVRLLRALYDDRSLWRAGILVSFFWLVGAVVLSLLPPLVQRHLNGNDSVVTGFLALFAVSIGIGTAAGARIMGSRVDFRGVAPAAFVMGVFACDLALSLPGRSAVDDVREFAAQLHHVGTWRAAIDLAGMAIGGGIFIVPTFAAVQAWSAPASRARMIGAVNILSALFMVGGAVVVGALQAAGVSLHAIFGALGAMCLTVGAWTYFTKAAPVRA